MDGISGVTLVKEIHPILCEERLEFHVAPFFLPTKEQESERNQLIFNRKFSNSIAPFFCFVGKFSEFWERVPREKIMG